MAAEPLFAKPNGNELYVLLLEKAFAKFAGSYSKLIGGCECYAWGNMTGETAQQAWVPQKNSIKMIN